MNNKIKILHLEDSLNDSELIHSMIENGDIAHEYFLADNKCDYLNILETENIDIILSDYSLPDYNGNDALKVAREKYAQMPFLFVTGTMGEDAAINAMINGATDYVLKHKLERLVPAIKRAIHEHKLVVKQKKAEAELVIANMELAFQNKEKDKRAAELAIANKELVFQNQEKEKRAIELNTARWKAEESDRLKSAFLANMSHEIRTPLNGILGFTELLKEPELPYEQQKYYIEIIEKSGARLQSIINDIIDISKIDSKQMDVSISDTNVNEQIEFISNFFKPEVEQKRMQIFFKNTLSAKEAIIKTDQKKIYAILTNLVKNAIKFTHSGSIEIGYDRDKACLVSTLTFYVKDTGIGIRPEQLEIVFERFRQGSETLNKKYEGAGLGLAISKAYVEMLGGKIWIESELGKGTTIYFTIPYQAASEVEIAGKSVAISKKH